MTREEIIKLARETGFEQLGPDIEDWVCFTKEIERFAALVAAAEREACAKLAETYREWDDTGMGIAAAIRERSANAGARGQV